jgi:hypothetical protein
MRPATKLGLVIAGYVGALLVASLALKAWSAAAPASQGDDGMRAFGESLLFLAVFAVASIPASVAALYFLRPYAMVWRALSVVAIGIATTGLAAACLYAIGRHAAGSVAGMGLRQRAEAADLAALRARLHRPGPACAQSGGTPVASRGIGDRGAGDSVGRADADGALAHPLRLTRRRYSAPPRTQASRRSARRRNQKRWDHRLAMTGASSSDPR